MTKAEKTQEDQGNLRRTRRERAKEGGSVKMVGFSKCRLITLSKEKKGPKETKMGIGGRVARRRARACFGRSPYLRSILEIGGHKKKYTKCKKRKGGL